MRAWGLLVVLCAPPGCYVGPGGTPTGATEGSTTAESDDASESSPDSGNPTSTPPTSGSGGSGDTDDSNGSADTSDSGDTDDPTTGSDTEGPGDSGDSGDTSGGPMSGCEGGPLAEPIAGCAPPPPPSTGDIHQDCVDRINQLRWDCQCLPPLMRWADAEMCSDDQSSADQNGGGPHGNFGMCSENAQNTCPNWGSEQQVIGGCLQAMWDEGPGEPFSEHGHYINMSSQSYTRVACGFSYDGGVWSNQNFSP